MKTLVAAAEPDPEPLPRSVGARALATAGAVLVTLVSVPPLLPVSTSTNSHAATAMWTERVIGMGD